MLLRTVLGAPTHSNSSSSPLLSDTDHAYIPHDIRAVRKKFDLEPSTQTLAACVRCSCTYAPVVKGKKIAMYPERCNFKKYRGSRPCGQLLVKTTKAGSTRTNLPIRPFVVQSYNDFLGGLLSRPGMEEAMERGTMLNDKHQLWDIKDGTGITEIAGPDGKPFMDGLQRSDLRLAWSLSVDWFNPHSNKIAGKKKSVGSIAMALLNLPPSIRYKVENLYVLGVIPGPREPSLDEINHFLSPLVEFFLPAWKNGTWFTKTEQHPEGRLARSVIAVAVNDLPAARKVGGFAGPTAAHFCNLCWLQKSDISNILCETWTHRTRQEHLAAAIQWRDAETKQERDRIFKDTGVRWSELLRLPYWDPLRFIVIDGMHNLFLGLVQFHFRDLIMIDKPANQEGRKGTAVLAKPINPKALENARTLWKLGASPSSLNRLSLPILEKLLEECGKAHALDPMKKRITKMDIIQVLLVRDMYNKNGQT